MCICKGAIEAPGEFFLCGVCVGMCGCEKITGPGGRGCVTTCGPVGRGEALGLVPSCATLVGP